MYPITLDLSRLPIAVVGSADSALNRLNGLQKASAKITTVFCPEPTIEIESLFGNQLQNRLPCKEDLNAVSILFVTGLNVATSIRLASEGRELGVLVNVEDKPDYCDFHLPSVARRGDLVIAVSTNGRSPSLSHYIRRFIEMRFAPEWAQRVSEIADWRASWQQAGESPKQISKLTEALIDRRGWFE